MPDPMIFTETMLRGAFVVESRPHTDERGSFARTFCAREFQQRGLAMTVAQCNVSHTLQAGTIRGLHFQAAPSSEAKLVRCARGTIFDVIVDLRTDSPTYKRHIAVELSESNHRALFVPESFAHGFQTLVDGVVVEYQMSEFYSPELARGIRYDDPAFGIPWPRLVTRLSEQDAGWPAFGA